MGSVLNDKGSEDSIEFIAVGSVVGLVPDAKAEDDAVDGEAD